MPQLKSNDENIKTYGSNNLNQVLIFRERLMKRFEGHEWVRVINLDDEPFYWQYLPAHAEKFEFSADPMKTTYREPVEAWMLKPGESEVIIGENAYLMIDGLYKKLVSKGYMREHGAAERGNPGRNFNWSDGAQQEQLIDKIYLGKESPKFGNATPIVPDTPRIAKAPSRLRA